MFQSITRNFSLDKGITEYIMSLQALPADKGYSFCITSGGHHKHLNLSAAPCELELRAIGDYIRESVTALQPQLALREARHIEYIIRDSCMCRIERAALSNLQSGDIKADHHYIAMKYVLRKIPQPLNRGWITVNLYKNDGFIRALNSRELVAVLNQYPDMPIYDSSGIYIAEGRIMSAATLNRADRHKVTKQDDFETAAERFDKKLALLDSNELLFTKKGIDSHTQKEIDDYRLMCSPAGWHNT